MRQTDNHKVKCDPYFPYIILTDLDGNKRKIVLDKDKVTIGRLDNLNDIPLLPDDQHLVTRNMHCAVEKKDSTAWLIDNTSINGTFIMRGNIMQKVKGEFKLQDNDVIMITGQIENGKPAKYWELLFKDPLGTVNIVSACDVLVYDPIQVKLFINRDDKLTEIGTLTPMEHKLLRYMDQRNKLNGNIPVLCTYNEIISILWDNIYGHSMNDVNGLIAALRRKIESDYKNPEFLINIRGMGYRLVTNP
jgi:pSer/pThr/pTyr-binding forkhead associated (FHA) protein